MRIVLALSKTRSSVLLVPFTAHRGVSRFALTNHEFNHGHDRRAAQGCKSRYLQGCAGARNLVEVGRTMIGIIVQERIG